MIIQPHCLLLCFAAVLLSSQTHAAPLPDIQGRVVGVHDGDTITVLMPAKVQVKVRLEGIDAPELNQAFGNRAKEQLSALVFGKEVIVKNKGTDRYHRTLGRVVCGVLDVNLDIVRRGFAWWYPRYSKEAALMAAQEEARGARRGLWSGESPVPPWEWRKGS